MYVIPRSHLSILNKRNELQTPAFYILLGEDEATKPKAYIGETENFRERVRDQKARTEQIVSLVIVFKSSGVFLIG